MTWFEKIKQSARSFMEGRNGADQLALTSLIAGFVLSLLSGLTRSALLNLLSLAAYCYTLFRMLSRNTAKREIENLKFIEATGGARVKTSQTWQRVKNMGTYKYVNCPECKTLLRLPKKGKDGNKLGSVTVTCSKCKHSFTTKI